MNKFVFAFGGGHSDGDRTMKELLGGKGANLAEMSNIGLPVPSGFTISTKSCEFYHQNRLHWPDGLEVQVEDAIAELEKKTDAVLGDPAQPLLLSVRSGAAVSMPGMMDTVLNLGMNDDVVEGLAKKTQNARFAYDDYRRFIDMFADVVMGIPHEAFEHAMADLKVEKGIVLDIELTADHLKELVDRYKAIYRIKTGYMFPQESREQLRLSINAVFNSWESSRAKKYRQVNKINSLKGTAVNVQAMVFGNMGDTSGTGVCFTRDPSNGENVLYGEYLVNAQGEDVVAGIRTPEPIVTLKQQMPKQYEELVTITTMLEKHYKDMQDIEFTIQEGKLFILQTRSGKRTGAAALKIAVEMVNEGIVEKEKAIESLVSPEHLDQVLHPQFDPADIKEKAILGKGLPASPGAAVGRVVFSSETAEAWRDKGEKVLLVRVETSPEDVGGMDASEGILTSRGGMTSHAAVVARGWGKPCVAGCNSIIINYKNKSFTNGRTTIKEGDWVSLDGTRGEIIKGALPLHAASLSGDFRQLMKWVDEIRTLGVRANAETAEDVAKALEFGAEGVGLARTEHMFFGPERIMAMRKMILSDSTEDRIHHLEELLPFQVDDFTEIFKELDGKPVNIRLLDPPLHEFLPHNDEEIGHLADILHIPFDRLKNKVNSLSEFNPMLGHRGCRLGITYPEITKMQVRAILTAALNLKKEGIKVHPEIMIPLVSTVQEFKNQKQAVLETARSLFEEYNDTIAFQLGTMIEVPRAALIADEIAKEAEFFSFGTNDLTQMTFGFSRDDANIFLSHYLSEKIMTVDPFSSLDIEGVGKLVTMATQAGRSINPNLRVGICGEHGGDPNSIEFFHNNGLDYISCSPYRVPIARFAAAQAALKAKQMEKTDGIVV
jgi:pyruvate,orthophosphate dikinase